MQDLLLHELEEEQVGDQVFGLRKSSKQPKTY
jgi:hypothetical protein